uniref:Uncharacterized protein n=1 Tax=Phaeomonas parva TaxID=124430 RepID=A0A7S1UAH2_9STRA
MREVELKHGRVSMLAILGHIATASGMRWDAAYDAAGHTFKEVPAGLAAFSKIGGPGLQWIILTVGVLEIGFYECKDDVAADYEARMDKMGWTDAKKRSKKNIEINNGRAAMMGILGLMVHEQINNDPYVLNAILGAPVRFNELYGA